MPNLLDLYFDIPIVTRLYTSACLLTTLFVELNLATPFVLYFNPKLIWQKYQIWRVFTAFLFFGPLNISLLINLGFAYRYCRFLEDRSFRGRPLDLVIMFCFGAFFIMIVGFYLNLLFLGPALALMLVYVWSRRNPFVEMNFLGFLNFQEVVPDFRMSKSDDVNTLKRREYVAPYLPWVLLIFALLLGNPVTVDILGIVVGHLYYYCDDILPSHLGGRHILRVPPSWHQMSLWAPSRAYVPPPEDRPGGFDW